MTANPIHHALDSFRDAWVQGHLDHQRATEAVEAAHEALRLAQGRAADDADSRRAREAIAVAERRLLEVESLLAARFDHFCGVPGDRSGGAPGR